ncbi:retrovirus-related pol polyprotein from transposon opus [Plakobranchus ocellatus]|uniref:Retrovirus-related pol polyprotein from transposon opus n=1 Tax=Plakobranchus ocellatus TaxID=259542 RepID=A0AAV3YLN3_9GAST|nr:retrovirus-related pol polyprotein from transposon opus [Plakobranchus ocellatus]
MFQGIESDWHFSKIDLSKSYWKIPVHQEDIPGTAFLKMDCPYEFLRMPFGMMHSGATLTRIVKMLVRGMDYLVDVVDNLTVHTPTDLGGLREVSDGAAKAAAASEFYGETNKVRVRGKEDRLPWSSAWSLNNRPSGREGGESSGYSNTQDQEEGSHIFSPQQGDLRLSGPPSGQGTGSGARTRDRRVPADLRADSQATVLPTPPGIVHQAILFA